MLFKFLFVIFQCVAVLHALVLPKLHNNKPQRENDDDGQCSPSVTKAIPMANFEPEKYFNSRYWYDIADPPAPDDFKCVFFNGSIDDTSAMHFNQHIWLRKNDQKIEFTITWQAKPDTGNAVYVYNAGGQDESQLTIVDTDYTTYSVIYTCFPRGGGQHPVGVSIYARQPKKPSNYQDLLDQLVDMGFNIDEQHFEEANTDGCPQPV